MASEVFSAREGTVNPINATGVTRRGGVLASDGRGGSVLMQPSSDKKKNEAMRFLGDHVSVRGASDNATVDGFVRENNGSYEVKVWNKTGQRWNSGRNFASIVPYRNNTGNVLSIRKQRGRWSGTLTERGNYGMPDRVTKVF